jgi:hypothetical protein
MPDDVLPSGKRALCMLKILRPVLMPLSRVLPLRLQRAVDRRLRAASEIAKLRDSTIVVVSFPKSGRTWMRALLSYLLQDALGLKTEKLLGNRNYHKLDGRAPVVSFTHDHHPRRVYGDAALDAIYGARKVVLLVRDPRDVEVSTFFHVSHRLDPAKKKIYEVEASGREEDCFDFLMQRYAGERNALSFLNQWAGIAAARGNVLIVRYEDLNADTEAELRRVCDFVDFDAGAASLRVAAERASFSSMKSGERTGSFSHQDSRFGNRGSDSADAFKVRRGKVGGYRDYLTPRQAEEIDTLIDNRLVRGFGYRSDEAQSPVG